MSKHATIIKCPCCDAFLMSQSMFGIYNCLPATYNQIKTKLGRNPGVEWMMARMESVGIVKRNGKVRTKTNQLSTMWVKTKINVYEYVRLN